MRRFLLLVGLALVAHSFFNSTTIAQNTPKAVWVTVERLEYDWNQDGESDIFILQRPQTWEVGGDSSRLTIQISGGRRLVVQNKLGWMDFVEDNILKRWSRLTLVKSRHFLFLSKGNKSGEPPVLVLFGWPCGSSPGTVHVLDLDPRGVPRVVFYQEEFEFTSFADLDGDTRPEIVGKPCLSQEHSGGLLTYDPFHVYVLARGGQKARLSLRLSRAYNLKHYYGWAGPNCSEELAVVRHPPGGGKPIIMKLEDARRLPEADKPPLR